MFLDGKLKHVQTILGADVGYGETRVTCMHVAEFTGKVCCIPHCLVPYWVGGGGWVWASASMGGAGQHCSRV